MWQLLKRTGDYLQVLQLLTTHWRELQVRTCLFSGKNSGFLVLSVPVPSFFKYEFRADMSYTQCIGLAAASPTQAPTMAATFLCSTSGRDLASSRSLGRRPWLIFLFLMYRFLKDRLTWFFTLVRKCFWDHFSLHSTFSSTIRVLHHTQDHTKLVFSQCDLIKLHPQPL